MYVTFKNPHTGQLKSVKVGFSWFLLFLTPPLGIGYFLKGMWLEGFCLIAGLVLISVFMPTLIHRSLLELLVGFGILAGWKGNKYYATRLLEKGWVMMGDEAQLAFARAKWGVAA